MFGILETPYAELRFEYKMCHIVVLNSSRCIRRYRPRTARPTYEVDVRHEIHSTIEYYILISIIIVYSDVGGGGG